MKKNKILIIRIARIAGIIKIKNLEKEGKKKSIKNKKEKYVH